MKKLYLILLSVLVSTGAFAKVVTDTIDIKGFGNLTSTSYVTTASGGTSQGGIAVTANNFNPSNGQIRGNQTNVANNFYLFNTQAFTGSITKVEVLAATDASNYLKNNLYLATGKSSQADVADGGTAWNTNFAWELDKDDEITFFKIFSKEKFTNGTVKSARVVVTYEASDGFVAAPAFTPAAAEFFGSVDVTLASETTGAEIYYTLDGSRPGPESGILYKAPFTLTATTTVKAVALKDKKESTVAEKTYTMLPEFDSLEDLVENLPATKTAVKVKVTLTSVLVDSIFVTAKGYKNGVYTNANGTVVELYEYDVPAEWEVGGTVSGTIIAQWSLYNGVPELQKWDGGWDAISYKSPVTESEVEASEAVGEVAIKSYENLGWNEYDLSFAVEGNIGKTYPIVLTIDPETATFVGTFTYSDEEETLNRFSSITVNGRELYLEKGSTVTITNNGNGEYAISGTLVCINVDEEMTITLDNIAFSTDKVAPNTILTAGEYEITATITANEGVIVPAEMQKYLGGYTAQGELTGDSLELVISTTEAGFVLNGFSVKGDAVMLNDSAEVVYGDKHFQLGDAEGNTNGALAITKTGENEYALADGTVVYNGNVVGTVTGITFKKLDDPTTGINSVEAKAVKSGKFLENGKLVIVKNGAKFNVAGINE